MATQTKAGICPAIETDDTPIQLTRGDDPRADSRNLAARLGVKHKNTYALIKTYAADFKRLGILLFETEEISGPGQPEKFALLNEDQAYLLLTYSKNTKRVREIKIALVMAFRKARLAADITKAEYLPTYHDLHGRIGLLAAGSRNARFVHMNMNRLLNQAVGIGAGERGRLDLPHRSLMVVAQSVAASAMRGAADHHDGYRAAKDALRALGRIPLKDADTHRACQSVKNK
ncbi:MAG: Rha family transcriptional regulator [Castellaniella sp.]|nr:Rha family transcriptional regulator [Castellaniella sp.]